MSDLNYLLGVRWDGAHWTREQTRMRAWSSERGKDGLITTNSNGQVMLARNKVGQLNVTLDNDSDRYNPWNSSSPLYPNVHPGVDVMLQIRRLQAGDSKAAGFTAASSQYLACASNANLQAGDIDFTIAGWVWLNSKAALQGLVTKWNSGGAPREYGIYYDNATDRFLFQIRKADDSANVIVYANSFGSPSINTWYFIVAQHDSVLDGIRIYINGDIVFWNGVAVSGGVKTDTAALCLGASQNPTQYLNGYLDSVGIWKRCITTAEIQSLYNSGNGKCFDQMSDAEKSGLVAFWDLNEMGVAIQQTRFDRVGQNDLTSYNNVGTGGGVAGGQDGFVFDVFRGKIAQLQNLGGIKDALTQLVAVDGWQLLSTQKVNTVLNQNQTSDVLLSQILSAAGWADGSSLDVGADVIPYAWVDDQDAHSAIHDLVESEFGQVWIMADGRLAFNNRSTDYARSPFAGPTQSTSLNEPLLSQPWDNIVNSVRIGVNIRVLQTPTAYSVYGTDQLVLPGQTLVVVMKFQDNLRQRCPITPASETTWYAMQVTTPGGFTPINFTSTAVLFAASAIITTINQDSVNGYLQMGVGQQVSIALEHTSAMVAQDVTSQGKYGIRDFVQDSIYQQSVSKALALANWLIACLKDPRPVIVLEQQNQFDSQFAFELCDPVSISLAYYSIVSQGYRVCKIQHQSGSTPQEVKTTFTLVPLPASAPP